MDAPGALVITTGGYDAYADTACLVRAGDGTWWLEWTGRAGAGGFRLDEPTAIKPAAPDGG